MISDVYIIQKATLNDLPFIASAIIAAEKGNSEKLSLATLFGINENQVFKLIQSMLEEEIDGCEFSLSSFLLAKINNIPIAAVGGWIEEFNGELPSNILKSNLIGFTFPKESIKIAQSKSSIIRDIQIERKQHSLQIEYVYIKDEFRGTGLVQKLIKTHIEKALEKDSDLSIVQVQVFGNNIAAIKAYEKMGFEIKKKFLSENCDALTYLPYNMKILMEEILK